MIASIVPVPGYRLAFRDITNSTNQRTMIASIVPVGHGGGAAALVDFAPPGAGVSHHAAEMMPEPAVDEFLGAGKPGTMKKLVELASRACGELERRRREEQPE